MSNTILVLLNSLTLAAVIGINFLAATGGINNTTVGEVSEAYDTLFAPAGYAFSIWGLIYLMLTGFVGFQWFALITGFHREIIDQTGVYLILINLANVIWLLLWVNERIGLSVLVMTVLLGSLILMVYRLKMELWDAPVRILMFVWWPIAIYFGWIIAATIANVASFLVSLTWDGTPFSPQLWTIILIVIATGIYLYLVSERNLRESAMVGIWTFVAIAYRHGNNYVEITATAVIAALFLFIVISWHSYINRHTSPYSKILRGEF